MEVAPGIIQLKIPIPNNPLGNLNCYLIEGTEGWLMVDTGWFTPETFDSLKQGLKTWKIDLSDIATIVITHIHPDHFCLAGRIKQISPKIELLMHRFEADHIESRYIKLRDLRQKIGAMLSRHGVPQYKISELESSSLPAMECFDYDRVASQLLYGPIKTLEITHQKRFGDRYSALREGLEAQELASCQENRLKAVVNAGA